MYMTLCLLTGTLARKHRKWGVSHFQHGDPTKGALSAHANVDKIFEQSMQMKHVFVHSRTQFLRPRTQPRRPPPPTSGAHKYRIAMGNASRIKTVNDAFRQKSTSRKPRCWPTLLFIKALWHARFPSLFRFHENSPQAG